MAMTRFWIVLEGQSNLQGLGEPLLHKEAVKMIEYARKRGIFTFFISNMTVMTDEIAEALVRAEHGYIIASVDAIDPEIMADIRRGAKFEVLDRIFKNIAKVEAAKKRLGKSWPEIHVNSILMKRTLPDVPRLVTRLKAAGVKKIMFSDLRTLGIDSELRFSDGSLVTDQSLLDLPPDEIHRALKEIKALDSDACRVEVPEDWGGVSQRQRDDVTLTCEDLWEKPYIRGDGIVLR